MTPDQIKLFEYLSKPHIGGNLDKQDNYNDNIEI